MTLTHRTRGSASLKQANKAEIKSSDLDFYFAGGNQLVRAVASGEAQARSLGQGAAREARAKRMEATFIDRALDTIKGQGDAYVKLSAPASTSARANPSTRELVAEAISLQFFPDGENIKSSEATGNAVMTVTPIRQERGADKKIFPAAVTRSFMSLQPLKTYTARGVTKGESKQLPTPRRRDDQRKADGSISLRPNDLEAHAGRLFKYNAATNAIAASPL